MNTPIRVAGCDLGKAHARFVIAEVESGGRLKIIASEEVAHEGEPLDVFADWYRRVDASRLASIGATGLYGSELGAPVVAGLPEDACIEKALADLADVRGPINLVSIGARGYGVLTRDAHGRISYLENDKCSSGTGETMVKIAGRFGMTIAEADAAALAVDEAIAITARCSVFAKSEMTHFGNQGRSADALFRGYFQSVARYVAALLNRVRVDGPVYAIGGGSRIGSLIASLSESLGTEVIVASWAVELEALGAARFAADRAGRGAEPLPIDPAALLCPQPAEIQVLQPARNWEHRVTMLTAPEPEPAARKEPCVLGLDLGSTGSKAVLTRIADGALVFDLYDRTRGNPVDAAQRLVRTLLESVVPDIRAVALTGSGREAAATVLRAALPEHADRIFVENEIVAHGTAAIRCDSDGGSSLSVVEIGGQDAKFIQISGGQIVESDMNKACSAGTGSFLEEQAAFYGVDDITEFTRLATQAARPPELGQMCTVFVAEAANRAQREGFAIPDLFAGFQYSVVHNYINRVMGSRPFGKRIFFQGKPASGPSLAWTLAAVTDREVVVPPNPGAMGAWGIGVCALEAHGAAVLARASKLPIERFLDAQVNRRTEFQCRDKRCATLCRIERTEVTVGTGSETVLSGGSCPKYEVAAAGRAKLPVEAPSAFDEREALLAEHIRTGGSGPEVVIPKVGVYHAYLPWLTTVAAELGASVRVAEGDGRSLSRGEERSLSFDSCAPVKVALGVCGDGGGTLLMPKVLGIADREGQGGATCPMEQALPEIVRCAQEARGKPSRFIQPRLDFRQGIDAPRLIPVVRRIAKELGLPTRRAFAALRAAAAAQRAWERGLAEIGRRTLDWARANGVPVVLVSGMPHVIFDPVVGVGLPGILRQNGVLALPTDCYTIPAETHALPRAVWGDANRILRAAVSARAAGDVYPLLLTAFGCGPASFLEHSFESLLAGYPHTTLESDGHGGAAGYVTRIQAFLHTVRRHSGRPDPTPAKRLQTLEPLDRPPLRKLKGHRIISFALADRVAGIMAACYRAFGYDAVSSGATSRAGLAAGRSDCSGKECVPYHLIWGAFKQTLEAQKDDKPKILIQVGGEGSCRNCMFSVKDRIEFERIGAGEVTSRIFNIEPEMGTGFMSRYVGGIVTWDLLNQLVAYLRPFEHHAGQVEEIYERYADALERLLESPVSEGPRYAGDQYAAWRKLRKLVDDASKEFAALLPPRGREVKTVLLTGDIYVRADSVSNDQLVRRLNERGLSVFVEPLTVLPDYLAHERSSEITGLPTGIVSSTLVRRGIIEVRRRLYGIARRYHKWLYVPDVDAMIKASRPIIDKYPIGEAPITVGSVIHTWEAKLADGIIIASPWGCGPALIAESLLRHRREIPMLFLYYDGSPADERKLNSFAYRLLGESQRAGERASGRVGERESGFAPV